VRIHFLASKHEQIVDYFLTPIRFNKNRLKDMGYDIHIYYGIDEEFLNCDILCLISKSVIPQLKETSTVFTKEGPVISLINKARKYANKIIWCDNSDSTSVTHFEILPHVDLYLKKQLFKDKSLYNREFYGGRIFTEFYHQKYGVIDQNAFSQFYPLPNQLSSKVRLSWNIGMGDMFNAFTKRNKIRHYVPDLWNVSYNFPTMSVFSKKNFDIFLSTSANLHRPTVAYHRKELIKKLRAILKEKKLSGSINGKRLTTAALRNVMKMTKILPSPFGWGEIGVRDYEAFINGALLLKPNMNHMETFPDIFIDNETYLGFDWSFDDLSEVIDDILSDVDRRLQIAQQGQKAYLDSISYKGMIKFCSWFERQIVLV